MKAEMMRLTAWDVRTCASASVTERSWVSTHT